MFAANRLIEPFGGDAETFLASRTGGMNELRHETNPQVSDGFTPAWMKRTLTVSRDIVNDPPPGTNRQDAKKKSHHGPHQ